MSSYAPTEKQMAEMRKKIKASQKLALDEMALTAAHLAVEDQLVQMRDDRMFVLGPRNGFIIHERDGQPSSIMRFGTRHGLEIAIRAYLKAIEK